MTTSQWVLVFFWIIECKVIATDRLGYVLAVIGELLFAYGFNLYAAKPILP